MALDLSKMSDEELSGLARKYEAQIGGIDTSEGAPFTVRAGASFKGNPEEKFRYVQERLKPENVARTDNGEIVWRKPGDKQWRAFDETGLSLADIADFAGDVPSLVGSVVGGLGGSVPGAALGGAAGEAVKQGISALLPGSEAARPVDRLLDVGKEALLAGVGQKIGNVVGKFIGGNPQRTAASNAYKQEADRLASSIGPDAGLTSSQKSGDRTIRLIEDQGRRNFASADVYQNFEVEKQLQPVLAKLERINDRLTSGMQVTDSDLGKAFKETFDKATDLLVDARKSRAAKDFRFLDEVTGNQPVIPLNNFIGELTKMAQDAGRPGMSSGMRKGASEAVDLLNYIKETVPNGTVTGRDMQAWLHNYGRAAQGKGNTVFANLDRAADREYAQRLFGSLSKDLDDAANATTTLPTQNVSRLLKAARDNYKSGSAAIDELASTVLSKRLGKDIPVESLERTSDWLRNLKPDEISASLDVLETIKPNIRQLTARNFLEDALGKAADAARKNRELYPHMTHSPDELLKALPDDASLKAILGPNAPLRSEISDVIGFLERATQRSLGTFSNQETIPGRVVQAIHAPTKIPHILSSIFAPKTMAEILTDPEKFKWFKVAARTAGKGGAIARRSASEVTKILGAPLGVEMSDTSK